ncbi:hypothetical protein SAMN05216169_102612 [Anoxybacillus pushchinoensis]|uniref:Uncharacterized protein n=1 Tax=Anoxybacillus pushchinoensis TaxID=150248 RepID=A0A1I0TG10_9BACL|nr:hypothetical protein [Anoxybacillus pushchinoensis]SFA50704.1 hypothetical protein SAMN05216169_102612 [Anoxybacillus pushchinoensis]
MKKLLAIFSLLIAALLAGMFFTKKTILRKRSIPLYIYEKVLQTLKKR